MADFFDMIRTLFFRLFEPKNRYGLTREETTLLVNWSSRSERGYDLAMEMALCVHEMRAVDFDWLLCDHGVVRPWVKNHGFPYQARSI